MVVLVIDRIGIGTGKNKGNSPVSAHPDRPNTLPVPLERVQYQSGQRHVLWLCRCTQLGKNEAQPISVLRLYPRLAASLEESLQPLVPESADHERHCNLVRYGLQEAERLGERRARTAGRTGTALIARPFDLQRTPDMGMSLWGESPLWEDIMN